ncbi:MAG: sulfotransferase, partial [Pseudomonadota bacterium]|nr:sulfotransferase [Pseudomonadota bacterium]
EGAIELEPRAPAAYEELAKNYKSQGNYRRALAAVNSALDLQPNSPKSRMLRGDLLFCLLDWKAAAIDFEFVFKQSPHDRQALQYWVVSLIRSNQLERLDQLCRDFSKDLSGSFEESYLQTLVDISESILGGGNYSESLAISNAILRVLQLMGTTDSQLTNPAALRDEILLRKITSEQFLLDSKVLEQSIEHAIQIGADTTAFLRCKLGLLLDMGRKDSALKICIDLLSRGTPSADLFGTLSEIQPFAKGDRSIDQMKEMLAQKDVPASEKIILQFVMGKALRDIGENARSFKHLDQGNAAKRTQLSDAATGLIDKCSWSLKTIPMLKRTNAISTDRLLPQRPIFVIGMPRSGTSLTEQILSQDGHTSGVGELPFLAQKITTLLGAAVRAPTRDEIDIIRRHYLEYVSTLAPSAAVTVDKTPFNLFYVGFILAALPEAKIVHTYRDPRAVCWSNYKTLYHAANIPISYSFRDLAKFYQAYRNMMNRWERAFPGRVHHQCYEELTANPEPATKRLYDFCELDWSPNVIDFSTNERQVRTVSRLQVRNKIYAGSSDEWRKYQSFLAPMTKALAERNVLSPDGVFEKNYED